jgi:hypothetical protein
MMGLRLILILCHIMAREAPLKGADNFRTSIPNVPAENAA